MSLAVVACGVAVALAATGAAAQPTPPADDPSDTPLDWGWEAESPDVDPATGTSISVPADAVFEFEFGQASSKPPPKREITETWSHPLPTGRLLSQYGNRGIIPGVTTSAFHNGIDLAAPAGTPIHAAGSGTVTYVGFGNRVLGLTGWVVVIEHLDGTSTGYNHMYESGVLVEVGDVVSAGDVIARVGSSGNSTGPHLHFSTWVDGEAVNPVNYLRERGVEVPGGRATKDEEVFGDPYEWNWGPMPVDHVDDPIEEPIGKPEKDPVDQRPSKPEKDEPGKDKPGKDKPDPTPSPTPTDPATEEPTPTDPATEEPTDPATEDPTETPSDPATEDPTETPTEDPTEEPSPTDPATGPSSDPSRPASEEASPTSSESPTF